MRYQLKTPWRNGTTHVEWDSVDFIAKLAALVPPPRAHLTRFHGLFAPNSSLRAQLTPSGRGKKSAADAESTTASSDERTPDQRRRAMSWAQRLKRLLGIDVSSCVHCGGAIRIVASIEEPTAIRAILAHFAKQGALDHAHCCPAPRGPPAVAIAAVSHHQRRHPPRKPTVITCGDDPAGARLARCRDSVRNGHGRPGCAPG